MQSPFRPLGWTEQNWLDRRYCRNRKQVFYYSVRTSEVEIFVPLPASRHTRRGLLRLAPLQWWRRNYPGNDRDDVDWEKAAGDVLYASIKIGRRPIPTEPPLVEAILRPWRGVNGLIIPSCPYCGDRHYHGGGKVGGPVIDGHRLAHCLETAPRNRGYILGWHGLRAPDPDSKEKFVVAYD